MAVGKKTVFYATCGTFLCTTFGFGQISLTSSQAMRPTLATTQRFPLSPSSLIFTAAQHPFDGTPPMPLNEHHDAPFQTSISAEQSAKDESRQNDHYGSAYIPVDSWMYPEMTRLYSLGYADSMFLSMRPWTRQSVLHMLLNSEDDIRNGESDEARDIYFKIMHALRAEVRDGALTRGTVEGLYSVYTRAMVIAGTPLRDSYHLGQTVVNDYGRPYQSGFNNITGAAGLAEHGRFSLFVRGEYQHSPSAVGYSQALSARLSTVDQIPFSGFNLHQATISTGPLAAQNPFRLIEATLSYHLVGHEISFGKSDAWLGPAQGGALAWSNNAENIYSFRINRVEPLQIPLLSRILGPVRYDFFYGSLQGHTYPNDPYTHSSMFSFRPSKNFEFGFQRTVIFGGAGHEPVTLHTFLKSFLSISDTSGGVKYSRSDPGARFSDFSASYRLPLLRKYATFYVDSISHDDVTPISAPRRAAYRTGLYISQFPGARKLDFRVEAVSTDPGVRPSHDGEFNYFETIQRQGYTNKGFIMGDWIGREAKGGQVWITYHLSGNEWVQVEFLNKKIPKDFIPVGTTQNSFKATLVKRFLHDDIEVNGWFQYERWKAPIYLQGPHSDSTAAIQVTFFPRLRSRDPKY